MIHIGYQALSRMWDLRLLDPDCQSQKSTQLASSMFGPVLNGCEALLFNRPLIEELGVDLEKDLWW